MLTEKTEKRREGEIEKREGGREKGERGGAGLTWAW